MLTSMEQSDFESFLKMSQSRPLFVRFLLQFQSYKLKKVSMVCLGFKPGAAGW